MQGAVLAAKPPCALLGRPSFMLCCSPSYAEQVVALMPAFYRRTTNSKWFSGPASDWGPHSLLGE